MRQTQRESRVVRSGRGAAGRMDFRGRLERGTKLETQVDADGDPPVIHRARVMAREASGRCKTSIWVVSQECSSCPIDGMRSCFFILRHRSLAAAPPSPTRTNFSPKPGNMEVIVMKNNTMKKLLTAALSLTMALSLAACSGSSDSAVSGGSGSAATTDGYKVAIVRQLDHASMNEIRDAIIAQLDVREAELSVTIDYEDFNGNNDPSTLSQIGAQIIADGYDVIIPIGTTAAQQMAATAEPTQTPVVYGTVSYPEVAKLTGIPYVTGTSDALNVELLLDMMLAQNPGIQTVGLLYSTSEVNSAPAIEDAKAYLDSKGIGYLEKTGNTSDEIIAAVSSMAGQVDAVFTPTDNVVQAAELAIAPTLAEAGIPHYTGADSFVRNGAFATCGVNYTDLGSQTADLAVEVLTTGQIPEYVTVAGDIITVNTETAATLGTDYSGFADMGSQLVEVQTTQN